VITDCADMTYTYSKVSATNLPHRRTFSYVPPSLANGSAFQLRGNDRARLRILRPLARTPPASGANACHAAHLRGELSLT
jgi:hypothetical protein